MPLTHLWETTIPRDIRDLHPFISYSRECTRVSIRKPKKQRFLLPDQPGSKSLSAAALEDPFLASHPFWQEAVAQLGVATTGRHLPTVLGA